ncbi:hypothetical protein CVT26_012006 [Gymnopilus dilepis]|uniref:FAD-binding PCMH-type domain-containing protein n=1 Tax=Gymnopilus dilepis TaxID=231916 RepID=A0A409YHR3_9AGAR|nr:hypothetical protein CVT26_012006 [Gymnopilus dilepis]
MHNVTAGIVSFLAALHTSRNTGPTVSPCRCYKQSPLDACWPTITDWSAFNHSVNGKLFKNEPPAEACYAGPKFDLQICSALEVDLTNDTFIADQAVALDFPIDLSCPAIPPGPDQPAQCTLGDAPVYTINATEAADVIAGVKFANERNLRLVVRNIGHDLLGRSTGFGALQIWIRFLQTGISFSNRYQATDGCSQSNWTGASITIGGGYVWSDVYEVAQQNNVIVVGAGTPTVGVIGGWIQGGGHSPASRDFGVGADQILEAQVVLADGKQVTASACQNSDLYSAIRGGGGGTFGILLSATVKVYPNVPVAGQTLAFAPLSDTDIPDFMTALADIYAAYPDLDDGGFSGYGSWGVQSAAPIFGSFVTGYAHAMAVLDKNVNDMQSVFEPVKDAIAKFHGTSLVINIQYFQFSDFWQYYHTLSGVTTPVGGTNAGLLASWLLDRKALTDDRSKLSKMLNITAGSQGQFTSTAIALVSGGAVFDNAKDPHTLLNPAWRKSYLHNIASRGWAFGTDAATIKSIEDDIIFTKQGAMKDLAPDTGSYMNEADRLDPTFLEDFYGASLSKLQSIKAKYDPDSLFYCPTCIGSNEWVVEPTGRLCRK